MRCSGRKKLTKKDTYASSFDTVTLTNVENGDRRGTLPAGNSSKERQRFRDLFFLHHEPAQQIILHNRDVEELETYAILKCRGVTEDIQECIRIVEETTGIAETTILTLDKQGRQITRTHGRTAQIMEPLVEGENILRSLGGLFSKSWRPKKGRPLKGPRVTPDSHKRTTVQGRNRKALVHSSPDAKDQTQRKEKQYTGLSRTQVELEMEQEHQDRSLDDLGGMIENLKHVTSDMSSEFEKQSAALGDMEEDVDKVTARTRQAYHRTRYLSAW